MILWLLQHIPQIIINLLIEIGLLIFLIGNFVPMKYLNNRLEELVKLKVPSISGQLLKTIGILLIIVGVFLKGLTFGADELNDEIEKSNQEIARLTEESKNITTKIETKYVIKQKVIKEKGDEIIKYVNTNNDADCSLHNSFVELHDSAAKNSIPDPTRAVDENPSGIELSEAKKVIIENYNKYNQVADQLKDLQSWIREQSKINN
jgi:hypothetical protein